jgi:hypothetical protein
MGNAHPFASVRSSFDPDTLQIMGVAFDSAWYKLLVSGSALAASWRAEHTREAFASQIVASARLGERDVDRLCDDALAHVQNLVVEPTRAPHRTAQRRRCRASEASKDSARSVSSAMPAMLWRKGQPRWYSPGFIAPLPCPTAHRASSVMLGGEGALAPFVCDNCACSRRRRSFTTRRRRCQPAL